MRARLPSGSHPLHPITECSRQLGRVAPQAAGGGPIHACLSRRRVGPARVFDRTSSVQLDSLVATSVVVYRALFAQDLPLSGLSLSLNWPSLRQSATKRYQIFVA